MTDILARIRAWALEVEGPKPPKWNASNDVNQRTGRQLATALRERFPEAFEEPALAESKILKTGAPEQVALSQVVAFGGAIPFREWQADALLANRLVSLGLIVRERTRARITPDGRAEAAKHEVKP